VPKVLTVLKGLLVSVWLTAQTPAPVARDGIITGQVIDGITGKPVSAVIVSISGPGMDPYRRRWTLRLSRSVAGRLHDRRGEKRLLGRRFRTAAS
jgi:hypothetical protein